MKNQHMVDPNTIIVFTDGASSGNPGPGGWGAVLVIPEKEAPQTSPAEVIELAGHEAETTNNRMELAGAIAALTEVAKRKPLDTRHPATTHEIIIYTDSRYLINGITKWLAAWIKNGWWTKAKKDVLNRDLWEKLAGLVDIVDLHIVWRYVRGHVGVSGNERADALAVAGTGSGKKINLYRGPVADYPYSLGLETLGQSSPRAKTPRRSRSAAYSYVSLLDGKIMTHKTWSECEARVKGKSGAKFKKALDGADEKNIIKEFLEKV